MKTWIGRIQDVYRNAEDLHTYDGIYGICSRLGYRSVIECWEANPLVGGSVHPEDYGRVSMSEEHHFKKRGKIRRRKN